MTYIRHWLLSYGGTLMGGADIWANNIRMFSPDPSFWSGTGIRNPAGALDDVATDVRAHVAHADSGYGADVTLEWVKFNQIGPDGRYTDQTQTHARYWSGTDRVFGYGGTRQPPQISMAVSFRTSAERGRGSRGRVFIPLPNVGSLDQYGRISPSRRDAIAAQWAAFIRALNNWPGIDYAEAPVVGIVSDLGSPGPARAVTRVQVGDVLDTQRRRRNKMKESYNSVAV